MSPLPSLLVVACAVALASAATPTKAPTYRVKTEAEIKMLATCASSRGSTANNVYTESAALKEVQKRRSGGRTGFDFAKKLDDFDIDIGALSKGDIDSPENRDLGKKYTTSLIYAVVPSFFLLFLGVICCVPCWFCKTCGECSSCLGGKDGGSCAGRGCCGKCNDYFMGWTCCPNFGLFDGACRYGPIADYPTCGWFALYEIDETAEPKTEEKMNAIEKLVKSCGKPEHDGEIMPTTEREDFFAQRTKQMEKRYSIPNIFWLVLLIALTVGIYICGITGQVNAKVLVDGITGAVKEGNCIVADSIDFVETISKPMRNITTIATKVIQQTFSTIETASGLGPKLTAIATAMTALSTSIKTDTCNLGSMPVNPTFTYDMTATATTIDNAATSIDSAADGPVKTLDTTLIALELMLGVVNISLVSAANAAKAVTEGELMDMLKDDLAPINAKVSTYLNMVEQYQGISVQVLFGLIWGFTALVVVLSIIWLIVTEFYECEQKKHHVWSNEENEKSTEKSTAEEPEEEEDDAKVCCDDCCCALFQIVMIWTMHVLHLIGWIMMMIALIIALVFNPVSIIISDGCVTANHFADHSARWLNAPGSLFANMTMMNSAVESCMEIGGDTNLLDAIGVGSVLQSFKNVSFGGASSLDMGTLDFSGVTTLTTTINALKVDGSDGMFDFTQGATDAITALNAAIAAGTPNTPVYTTTPPDPRCYGSTATALTCAPDATFTAHAQKVNIKTAQTLVLALSTAKPCLTTKVDGWKQEGTAIKVLVDALQADMTSLQSSLGSSSSSMKPIGDNIDAIYGAGSCTFVRRRMNGMLDGVCGNMLEGVAGLAASLILIGLFLLGFNFIVHNFVVQRFRMYDVACWHHNHSVSHCGQGDDDDAAEGAGVELSNVGAVV